MKATYENIVMTFENSSQIIISFQKQKSDKPIEKIKMWLNCCDFFSVMRDLFVNKWIKI